MKFNQPVANSTKTVNFEGAVSYRTDPRTELVSRVLCTLVGEPKFYASGEESDQELVTLLRSVGAANPEFCLKLAAYARNEMHLRSVPQLILVEMAQLDSVRGTGLLLKYAPAIIRRADEITECIAYQIGKFGRSIPKRLKKAIALTFNSFSRYQFAKYNRDGQVRMRDAMFLCHPNPKDEEHGLIFRQLADQTLEPPKTWEVIISENGSTKEAWGEVVRLWLESPRFGNYMAALRNLRNLLQAKVDAGLMRRVCDQLRDRENVRRSKQLPFRFLSAYRQIERVPSPFSGMVLAAVSDAMDASVTNIPHLPGMTGILADLSGSMESPLSERGSLTYSDVGAVLGAGIDTISNGFVVGFGEIAELAVLNRRDSVLTNAQKIRRMDVGGSTNAWRAMELLEREHIVLDRVILLSDMQCWDSSPWSESFADSFRSYRKTVAPRCLLYSVDLAGYGQGVQIPQGEYGVALLAGWSDRLFQFISGWEENRESQVKAIGKYDVN